MDSFHASQSSRQIPRSVCKRDSEILEETRAPMEEGTGPPQRFHSLRDHDEPSRCSRRLASHGQQSRCMRGRAAVHLRTLDVRRIRRNKSGEREGTRMKSYTAIVEHCRGKASQIAIQEGQTHARKPSADSREARFCAKTSYNETWCSSFLVPTLSPEETSSDPADIACAEEDVFPSSGHR
jgi:hypothetical protein